MPYRPRNPHSPCHVCRGLIILREAFGLNNHQRMKSPNSPLLIKKVFTPPSKQSPPQLLLQAGRTDPNTSAPQSLATTQVPFKLSSPPQKLAKPGLHLVEQGASLRQEHKRMISSSLRVLIVVQRSDGTKVFFCRAKWRLAYSLTKNNNFTLV